MQLTDDARFWAKVNENGPVPSARPELGACWLWTGARISNGYGNLKRGGRSMLAHRYAREMLVGPIPEGSKLDHLCRVRHCVRPTHTDPVTQLINVQRGEGHGSEDNCPDGHPYDEVNTYIYNGTRACRICRRRHSNAYKARKRG